MVTCFTSTVPIRAVWKLWSCWASDLLWLLARCCVVFCCWGVVEVPGSVLSVMHLHHGALVAVVQKVAAFQSGGGRERERERERDFMMPGFHDGPRGGHW